MVCLSCSLQWQVTPDKDWPKVDDHMLSVLSDCGLPNYQRNHERVPHAGAKAGAGLLEWFEILLKMCTGKDIVMKAAPWSIPIADEEAQVEYEKKVNTSISAWKREAEEAVASQGDLVDKGDAVREMATIMRPFPEQQHFGCSQRSIAFSPELMDSFGGKPNVALLEELGGGLERFVHREFRDDQRLEVEEEVDSETSMPFTDISRHPSTQAPIAKDMLRRWQADIKKYKVQGKTSMRSALRGLDGQMRIPARRTQWCVVPRRFWPLSTQSVHQRRRDTAALEGTSRISLTMWKCGRICPTSPRDSHSSSSATTLTVLCAHGTNSAVGN
jgi:hypothetical protein